MIDTRGLGGKVVKVAQPLVGDEHDEITAMVMRLKRADERTRKTVAGAETVSPVHSEDLKWAEDWKLPSEVFDYFVLEHVS